MPGRLINQFNEGSWGNKLVDQSVGRSDLYFEAVMEFAVCVDKMRIRIWKGHAIEPSSSCLV
jgi:hypothetical protein